MARHEFVFPQSEERRIKPKYNYRASKINALVLLAASVAVFVIGLGERIVALGVAAVVVALATTVYLIALRQQRRGDELASPPPAPAGWYPDPTTPGTVRWFDGVAWTAHTAPAG